MIPFKTDWCETHDRWYVNDSPSWKGSKYCDKGTMLEGPCKTRPVMVTEITEDKIASETGAHSDEWGYEIGGES